jgi:hypothetical protein
MRPVVLHLNAASPLVLRLAKEDFNDPYIQEAWLMLYNNAFVYSRQVLSFQNLELLYTQTLDLWRRCLNYVRASEF